jgi:hypothetical protein
MSFDINKWKKFLVTESQDPELLEEALEDRVPVSVAEEIREDVSALPWAMSGGDTSQDEKGVENLLADLFVQEHDPGDNEEKSALNIVRTIIWRWKHMISPQTKVPHRFPLPSGHRSTRTFEVINMLEYDKYPNITLHQAHLEMTKFFELHAFGQGPSRIAAWNSVKKEYMEDPEYANDLWVDRPMPKAVLTFNNFANEDKPAALRVARSFKKFERPMSYPADGYGGKYLPLDDFQTNHATFQTIIDYFEPIDKQLDAITDYVEKQNYWDEVSRMIKYSINFFTSREAKLIYNYLRPYKTTGLSEAGIQKVQTALDNTDAYYEDTQPVSYKLLRGVQKTLRKIVAKDQGISNEIKDKLLVKLETHFQSSYKNMYREIVKGRAGADVMEFLGQKSSNWRQLKGKTIADARKYATAAISNFESADQIRIKYPDGSYWYEIGSAGCQDDDNEWRDKELKKARQRHANCGADGGGSIWTLRYKDQEGNIESEVMVSYFKEKKKLGQIKGSPPNAQEGQGNRAPVKKWWKHILDLVNQLKIVKIDERGQYTDTSEMKKFEPFILWIKENADHDVEVEFKQKPERTWQPDPDAFAAQNPNEQGGIFPPNTNFFQERIIKNLNLKPKKKLSNNAQAKLEWYNRRRKK